MDKVNIRSDAEQYCGRDEEKERFYEIFFTFCKKYHVSWASADEMEKAFIEEITRVTYDRDRAIRMGTSLADVRLSFA